MAAVSPVAGSITDTVNDDDDDSTGGTIDSILEESKQDIERVLSQGKSFREKSMSMRDLMASPDVDEELHDLNIALGKGNEDFDYRHLSKNELLELIRGKPMKETFSNVGNMMKFTYPEISRHEEADSVSASRELKKSLRDPHLDDLQMSVTYSSLSKWTVAQNSLKAQDCYLNIIKYIFLRESSLIKIQDMVLHMDKLYWRYANTYIARKLYFKNNVNCEELKQIRLQLHDKQELLSVAIAHHRSISVDIVENVQLWRKYLQQDVSMKDVASLFWNGTNYLIKMLHDTPQLFKTQTMWMWLGFDVDSFIIPPRQLNPHTERLNRERKAHKWKEKRDEHQTAALKRLMSQQVKYKSAAIVDRDAVRRQTAVMNVQAVKPRARRGRLSSPEKPDDEGKKPVGSQSTPILPPIGASAQAHVSKSEHTQSAVALQTAFSDDKSEEGSDNSSEVDDEDSIGSSSIDSSSITSVLTDDSGSGWRELRDSCMSSWNYYHNQTKEDPNLFEQEEDFWENIDHSEHLVEAATGYLELFPKRFIVPPMKKPLIARCRACERVLQEEVQLAEQVKEKVAISHEMKVELDKEVLQEKLELLDTEEKQMENLIEMEKVRCRQENMNIRDQRSFNEVSREYVSHLLDGRKPYQRYISSARSKTRSPSPSRSSPSRPTRISSPRAKNSNKFAVFLTAPSIAETDNTMSTFSYIPENVVLKMEPEVLKERIKSVVENDRQACVRLGSSLVLRTEGHRRNRAQAYKGKPKTKRNALEAIVFMQALIRGVITRHRLSRKNRIHTKMAATLFIQKCLRNYIKRCRARVKRRLFKADCLRVRKQILMSHRSADIIKTFFRYLVFLRKRTYFLNKYAAIARLDVPRMTRVLDAALRIQSIFRAFSTRVWFTNVVNESRKRLKVGKIGPKYKSKILKASRRDHHFTIAGSGGFRFRWKYSPEKNSVLRGTEAEYPLVRVTEESVVSIMSSNVHKSQFHGDESPGPMAHSRPSPILERTLSSPDGMMSTGRRPSLGSVSDESVSLGELSLSLQGSNSHGANARSVELKKRSNIRGKIAMLKGGSRSHHKGVNLLRAVPVKEREFVQHKPGTANSVAGASSSFDGSSSGARSHSYAYENPNVHVKAEQERMGSLSGSLYSNSLNKKANELSGLLQDVYGFQK